LFNSFDGGLPAGGFRAFATRLVCLNGMTIPKTIGRFSFRHLGDFNPDPLREALTSRIQPILNTANIWEDWAKFTPNRTKIGEFVSTHLGRKASEKVLVDYDKLADRSLWGLYNLLTFHSTHELKVRNVDNLRLKQWELESVINQLYTKDLK
jgi:hypothetical protein